MGTQNNDLSVRNYQKQFKQLLKAVFKKQSYFSDFFGGELEALDGVQHNAVAFSVKTSDIPVVVGVKYNKDANVAFGTGTGNSSRFGQRNEVIYRDTDVPYTWEWVFHEGIDRHTVNNDFNAAVADRLDLLAQAKIQTFNTHHGKFISSVAGKEITVADLADDKLLALFNELSAYYVNLEAVGTKVIKVNTEMYNAIVDHPLVTTAKNSSVRIDDNGIVRFKGFLIQEIPDAMFQAGEYAYSYITNIGKAFTGITTSRTINSEDFDGVALQGAGKAGEYIIDDNKKAVVKIKKLGE